jgi:hypothetical protein
VAALTILDELALSQPKLRKGILKTLVEQVMLQDRVPYVTTGSKQATVAYLSGVPTVSLRMLNEASTTIKASFSQLTEVLTIIDNDIDIDPVFLDENNHIQNIQVAQTENVVASIGYRMNDLFVNGNSVSDAKEPVGLIQRLGTDSRFSGQTINSSADTTKSDWRGGVATDAEILLGLNRIDQLLYRVDNKADALLVNQQMVLNFWAHMRQLKMLDTTRDQFDREIMMYRKTPIIDVGFKETGAVEGTPAATTTQGDQVIGNDSDSPTGNGANAYTETTPVYAIRFGENFCTGLQQTPMRVKPMGETDASPHYVRTNIRWVVSPLSVYQKRAIARLVGFDAS